MAPDLSFSKVEGIPVDHPHPLSQVARGEIPRLKFRARFRKAGDLRLVSHHDLMHVVERMFRRADLRLAVTQGFNPHPKMTFALSLALGVVGIHEVLEFETAEPIAAEEVERRLKRQCPPGLVIVSVRAIEFRVSAQVRRALYRVQCGTTLRVVDAQQATTSQSHLNEPRRGASYHIGDQPPIWSHLAEHCDAFL